MRADKDPMGAAIADYFKTGKAGRLRVFSPDFDEDEIPVETLFRSFEDMPALEKAALTLAKGKTLDVGVGAGCHALVLQDMGKDVTAIDISPLSVQTMAARGVTLALEQDFWLVSEKYDTILMLMNGIGIVGTTDNLPRFFTRIDSILAPGGQVLLDSSDISYLFEDEDGMIMIPEGEYYGQLSYRMRYKKISGESFPWLYIDFDTLSKAASHYGFKAEQVLAGEHYDYLARITRK